MTALPNRFPHTAGIGSRISILSGSDRLDHGALHGPQRGEQPGQQPDADRDTEPEQSRPPGEAGPEGGTRERSVPRQEAGQGTAGDIGQPDPQQATAERYQQRLQQDGQEQVGTRRPEAPVDAQLATPLS